MFRYLFAFFLITSCLPKPTNNQQPLPHCFDNETMSLNDLTQLKSAAHCRLYDYKYVFPLEEGSCDFWSDFYSPAGHYHFTQIKLFLLRREVCFKQVYLGDSESF